MSSSLLESAGFSLPDSATDTPPVVVRRAGSGSLLESAGFSLPGQQASAPADDSWKDREAMEGLAAQGIPTAAPGPAKPGRGIWQAVKDTFNPVNIAEGIFSLPQRAIEASARDVQNLGTNQPMESAKRAADVAMLLTGPKYPAKAAGIAAEAGTSSQAVNRLVDMIEPENVPGVVERLKSNPRLALADVSDPVRTAAQGLIDPAQPKAQNALVSAVKGRIQSAPDAVNSAYTKAMGPSPDVVSMVEGLKERARRAGREAIQPALENSKLVDTSPVIEAIDAKLSPGVNPLLNPKSELPLSAEQTELARLKQQLISGSGEQLFDAQRLHRIQSDIGDQAYQLSKSPDPKDRLLGGQLRDMNEKLIGQIDEATGGAYRPARQKFKDAKDISAAFESGFDTLKNRQGLTGALEDSPRALTEWIAKATPEEIMARKLGTRADIDQKIRTAKNQALAGESITRIEYNREKLRKLFGDTEADRLIRTMEDTRDMATTNAKILANSKTAETQAAQRALAVPKVTGGNPLSFIAPIGAEMISSGAGLPGVGFAASMASRGAYAGVQKLAQINALARNAEIAKAAVATGQPRALLINKLLAHPKVRAATR
jgi:hypothetical protein